MDFPDVSVTSQFIRRARPPLSCSPSPEPDPFGPRNAGAVHQLGLTHLSFRVPTSRAVAAHLVELGGVVVDSSRTAIDFGGTPLSFVYCTDPDGVRVELMDLGG